MQLLGCRDLPKIESEIPDPYCRTVAVSSGADAVVAADPLRRLGRELAKTKEVTNTFAPVWNENLTVVLDSQFGEGAYLFLSSVSWAHWFVSCWPELIL
eukprot:SAG31_NODE_472_length_15237_cov_3.424891_8_plen_99_part_00